MFASLANGDIVVYQRNQGRAISLSYGHEDNHLTLIRYNYINIIIEIDLSLLRWSMGHQLSRGG